MVGSRKIQSQRVIPEVIIKIDQWTWVQTAARSRIIDQNVDGPKRLHHLLDNRGRRPRVGQVSHNRDAPASETADLLLQRRQFTLRAGGASDSCALLRKAESYGAP